MKKNNTSKALQNVALVTHLGLTMVITIGGGILLGSFVDKKLGTNSIFLASFTVLAVFSAFVNLYTVATKGFTKKGK